VTGSVLEESALLPLPSQESPQAQQKPIRVHAKRVVP
jgi:hypothetical protein